jgi:mannosyl-3-phosphoglycerate phosphatase
MKPLVFTDLDATLLDSDTYSWAPATDALEALKERRASIVLVSSKTFAEMEPLHDELRLNDPFVVENGGGIVFRSELPIARQLQALGKATDSVLKGDLLMLPLGVRYDHLVTALAEISLETGIPLKGFATMSVDEVASLTGLGISEAERAKLRDFDEPFVIPDRADMPQDLIEAVAKQRGLTAVQGGRFWHLIGHEGKGRAVSLLIEAFRRQHSEVITIGLGDSPNDYPFLELVDIPVVLGAAHRGIILPESLKKARLTSETGPTGWNGAILAWLSEAQT